MHLLLGLSLTGLSLGIDLERSSILHEFILERRTYQTYAFQTVSVYAHPIRFYTDEGTEEYAFTWRTYAREEFEFLGSRWRYGVGGGFGLQLTNHGLQLVDSSFLNVVNRVSFYPTLAVFTQIHFDESNALKLVGTLDANSKFPFSGGLTLLFVMSI